MRRANSVSHAKLKLAPKFVLAIGIVIGLLLPLGIDYILFGTTTPCQTVTRYEDGSSIQACEVRG